MNISSEPIIIDILKNLFCIKYMNKIFYINLFIIIIKKLLTK